MCMCKVPSVNGTPNAYCWNDASKTSTYPVMSPELLEGDTVLFDEPGRCGRKCDSHSHHFTLVKNYSWCAVVCRHGNGTERYDIPDHGNAIVPCLASMDSDSRYWTMQAIWTACQNAASKSASNTRATYEKAIIQKRVKVRTRKGRKSVHVMPENMLVSA